ncbi:hypothetical protein LOK49_LG14G00001 [Camellia lanceoleosa]|uniref:Uncharacterized protein n=1 Tax=Camellia lanceoleosa TaxID=1840588 RepID=A0ACC0FAF3_9ERIC|nr:hypothetical protein LOK49_LG14G00001 [Camellia lanceoleosa]
MAKSYSLDVIVSILLFYHSTTSYSKGIGGGGDKDPETETDGVIRRCWASDIRIYQWQSGYTALNIPQYTVQIVNEAWGGGDVFDVHISCGEFASFSLVNPMVFHRIGFTHDCLLLNGGILHLGEVITFQYANILPYTFNVVRLRC